MNRLIRLLTIFRHPRELRLSLSGLGERLSGNGDFGGLSPEESAVLVRWANESAETLGCKQFIEIGTLFGLTARSVALKTSLQVTAVDNFSWNPFGLRGDEHEAFARRILEGSDVHLIRSDSIEFLLEKIYEPSKTIVFLDGSHTYEDVRREIVICREKGVRVISGHDYGREAFGVTRAVNEILGDAIEVKGTCWRWVSPERS